MRFLLEGPFSSIFCFLLRVLIFIGVIFLLVCFLVCIRKPCEAFLNGVYCLPFSLASLSEFRQAKGVNMTGTSISHMAVFSESGSERKAKPVL
jgi:hypothetical protein